MTSEVILHNVSIHRNFHQNRLINDYAKKKKSKISEYWSHRVPESRSFLVRYRRTYIFDNNTLGIEHLHLKVK